jgi:hypothetical protein
LLSSFNPSSHFQGGRRTGSCVASTGLPLKIICGRYVALATHSARSVCRACNSSTVQLGFGPNGRVP